MDTKNSKNTKEALVAAMANVAANSPALVAEVSETVETSETAPEVTGEAETPAEEVSIPAVEGEAQGTPVAEEAAKEEKKEEVKVPFVIAQAADFAENEAFVAIITSDEGKKEHKVFAAKFKNMITGMASWLDITEKKYANLNKLRLEFAALPPKPVAVVTETPAVPAAAEPAAQVEVLTEVKAEEPAAEVTAEEVK